METLLGLLSCFAAPVIIFVTIVFVIFAFWLSHQIKGFLRQQRKKRRDAIGENAVMAPAVVFSAWNGIVYRKRMWMTFDVEVHPDGRQSFRATFKDWVVLRTRNFVAWGERKEDAGKKIWVTYDTNDPTKMIFEHYDVEHRIVMGKKAFNKIYKRNEVIRETGEEALALILEAEDLDLHTKVEKDFELADGPYMRFKVEVYPQKGVPYHAETQALVKISSLPKYEVGKKCYVKFDPQDRSEVCISRPLE